MKGCQADGPTNLRKIKWPTRQKHIMESYGLTEKCKIMGIGLRNEEGKNKSLLCTYLNKDDETKSFQFRKSFLDRQKAEPAFFCLVGVG